MMSLVREAWEGLRLEYDESPASEGFHPQSKGQGEVRSHHGRRAVPKAFRKERWTRGTANKWIFHGQSALSISNAQYNQVRRYGLE